MDIETQRELETSPTYLAALTEELAKDVVVHEAPEQPEGGFVGSVGSSTHTPEEILPWSEPGDLTGGLLPVPAMSDLMIPEPFKLWLCDIAERMQCPLEFPVLGSLVALASLVGRRVGMRPKRYDDWLVIPNLWGAIIGRPGILKSPALAEAMKPLQRLEAQAREGYEEALRRGEFVKLVRKAQKDDLERKIHDMVKEGRNPEPLFATLMEERQEPVPVRYVVNDSTVEKLGELLNQNPYGLLLFRDELTGWLRTLDREGHQNDRAFYCEAWNGNGAYTYDRIERGTLHVKACCISILGGIQPGPLADYLRVAVRGGAGDDGLVQRFQLAVYPDDSGSWRNVDRWPDTTAKSRAFFIFEQLATQPVSRFGVTLVPTIPGVAINTDEEIPFLHFAADSQGLFDEWRTDLERKIRARDEHPALEAHLAKYRSLMPSLALLFHLVAVVDGTAEGLVSERATKLAAAWCDFLEEHARRIYQGVTQYALFSARQLADRIRASALPSPFTAGVILRKGWAGLSILAEVRDAAEILEDSHWLRSEKTNPGEQGGRPRFHYHINPSLLGKKEAA